MFEVTFKIDNNGKYTSYLLVHVDDCVGEDAAEEAYEYAENVLGIPLDQLTLCFVDEIE